MGLISKLTSFEDSKPKTKGDGFDGYFGFDPAFFTSRKRFAGVNVSSKTAIELSTAYACIRDKAESVGQLPIRLRKNGRIIREGNDRLRRIFTKYPNSFMNRVDLLQNYIASVETTGAWYAYTPRNKHGSVYEIVPFRYQRSVSTQMDANGNVYYTYVTNDGKPNITFNDNEIIAIKLFTLDGLNPISPIQYNARALGIAIAQEDYLGSLMENGAVNKGMLTTDNQFDEKSNALARLREEWQEKFGGAKNAGRTPILENGLKWMPMGISPADTELIAQRTFSAHQICSIFRVPPERVALERKGGFKTLEENNKEYLNSLMSLLVQFELEVSKKLPEGYELDIDQKQFAKGDYKSLVEGIGKEVSMGLCMLSEGREDLGREYVEGSEVFAISTNNLTFGDLSDIRSINNQQQQQPQQQEQGNVGPEKTDQ